jgi:hypothetical protein
VSGAYVAVLGGTETFGKYVPEPYPALLEDRLGLPVINLASPHAGPDAYLADPDLLLIAQGARAVILQLPEPQNLSNRFFSVHPRRNDRFLGPTPALRALYRDVDFTEFAFNRHVLQGLARCGPRRFAPVADALRQSWVTRTRTLIGALGVPVVPVLIEPGPHRRGPGQVTVDTSMLEDLLGPTGATLVHLPARAETGPHDRIGMVIPPAEADIAGELPDAQDHRALARALAPVVARSLATASATVKEKAQARQRTCA